MIAVGKLTVLGNGVSLEGFEAARFRGVFIGMEREPIPSTTLDQKRPGPLGILDIRKRHYGIVGWSRIAFGTSK
jgi:hypothetical protein